ncbi:APC family permease [Brevibacillus fluminis]|uniref:APC family permease n=1 Tax=Brevibacillus fluminis TaxID=511487 RepID=UPI003F8A4D42
MEATNGKLKRSLQLRHLVFFGLAYMAPFTVFDTFGIVSDETRGHVPAAYILTTIAILFTAFSYSKMVTIFPSAGSAYTYTKQTMNAKLGFLVGWTAFLDYLFLPMINALLTVIYCSSVFPDVPPWIWCVGILLLTTVMNIAGMKISVSANSVMVLFQLLVAAIFVALTIKAIVHTQTANLFTFQPFYSEQMSWSTAFTGASILALSFLGFDAVTTLSEETIEPKKNVPRGIILIALVGGLYFIAVSYFMQALFPTTETLQNIEGASPEIALHIGGMLFQSVFLAGAIAACISNGLATQASAARLLYAMGRDGVLPKKVFGNVHPRYGTPIFNIVFIGMLALLALFLDLETAASFINFGAFTAFTFVNLCVIVYYFKQKHTHTVKSILANVLSPLLGISFNAYLWYNLEVGALIIGLIWVAIGLAYLIYVTKWAKVTLPDFEFEETVGGS